MSEADFSSRLAARIQGGQGPAVVGLDPRVEALPAAIPRASDPTVRITAFYRAVLPVLAPHVPAVKPNIAFFERYGASGFAAYEATCRLARDLGLLVIGDVKRGDIGSTAEAYADIHLELADAITVHPYLGSDAMEPFLTRCREDGRGLFVLVRTSNPSAAELQDLPTEGGRVCEAVARAVDRWGADLGDPDGYSPVGAVVGATSPEDVTALRALMPRAWLLLPGVGAQGAAVEDTRAAFDAQGLGGLASQSRAVMQCFDPGDEGWLEAIERAAQAFGRDARAAAGLSSGTTS